MSILVLKDLYQYSFHFLKVCISTPKRHSQPFNHTLKTYAIHRSTQNVDIIIIIHEQIYPGIAVHFLCLIKVSVFSYVFFVFKSLFTHQQKDIDQNQASIGIILFFLNYVLIFYLLEKHAAIEKLLKFMVMPKFLNNWVRK